MDFLNSPNQMAMLLGLIIWLLPMVKIWVRFDGMPHAAPILIAILILPLMLVDEFLRFTDSAESVPFLIGIFRFVPLMITILLFISVHKIVHQREIENVRMHYGLGGLFFLVQIPFLFLPSSEKVWALHGGIVGDIGGNWPYYLFYALSSLAMIAYAMKMEEMLREYNDHLPEHVVDVDYYRTPSGIKLFNGLVTVSFGSILLLIVVAPNLVPLPIWQTVIAYLQFAILYLLINVLLQKQRYAPAPIDFDTVNYKKFNEEQLRIIIAKAERAVLVHKAYKHLGLRLKELTDIAHVEPEELIVATKSLLGRDFRAYMYHYRIQYARKIIMRSDIKLATIAKKLGFESEKELSEMFVKYVQANPDEEFDQSQQGQQAQSGQPSAPSPLQQQLERTI